MGSRCVAGESPHRYIIPRTQVQLLYWPTFVQKLVIQYLGLLFLVMTSFAGNWVDGVREIFYFVRMRC